MTLRQLTDDVWELDGGHVKIMPGAYLPLRAVVARLEGGALWVHSPVALDDDIAAEIDALGTVTYLVAPNNLHHMYVGAWKERWPEAQMVGARGLRKKRTDLAFDATLDENPSFPGIESLFIEGAPAWGETVFFHQASKTLICTDLLFNVRPAISKGFLTPLVLRMSGAWNRPMQSRLIRTITKDRARAAASVEQVLQWPFERVAMAHGYVIEDDANAILRAACHWMLGAPKGEAAQLTV